MFSQISVSIQTIALRMFLGFVFVGLVVASHTAQSEEDFFAPTMDVATIQSAISNTGAQHAYRLSTGIALTRSEIASPFGSGFGNTPRLEHLDGPTPDTIWPTNTRLKNVPDNALNSALNSLSAFLRYESKDDRFVIKPKRHSISVEWRKSF